MRLANRRLRIWQATYLSDCHLWRVIESVSKNILAKTVSDAPLVLDIGCGHKPYADLFIGCQYIGMNHSDEDASPDILGDAQSFPFENDFAEIVFCTQVAEHLPQPHKLFNESYRVLKPGGFLILTAPFHWPLHEEPYDYFRFTRYGLEYCAKVAGFREINISSVGSDWAQICCQINLKLNSRKWALIRIAINLIGLLMGIFSQRNDCPLNYIVTATK